MIDRLIERVLEREGGYTDHPHDRGGPTNMGITQRVLEDYRQKALSKEDVQELPEWEAKEIYLNNYWIKPGFSLLGASDAVIELLFDAGVHHGTKRATILLQKAVGAYPDGILGPMTLQAVHDMDERSLLVRLVSERVRYYGRIITRDPTQAVFAHGWMNRMGEFIEMA